MKRPSTPMLFLIALLLVVPCFSSSPAQIFSKIVITSDTAICKKDPKGSNQFVFEYLKNVVVTFADQSRVTADMLTVVLDSMGLMQQHKKAHKKADTMDQFKSITFKQHVHVTSAQRQATANEAHIDLKTQRCVLEGDVKIWQQKVNPTDLPVVIESSKAELDLVTNQVQLLGSSEKPVQTTITLEGHPALASQKKKHKSKTHD